MGRGAGEECAELNFFQNFAAIMGLTSSTSTSFFRNGSKSIRA